MQAVKKKIDFTHGKVFGKILLFVLPIIATNLLQTFYNAADMMVVGLSSEANAKAAIGMTNAMITLVINMLIGFSVGTNFTAVLCTFNNIGPGLEAVGPTCNFSQFSDLSKLVLSWAMLAGRLEIFPMLVLFSRGTWKQK